MGSFARRAPARTFSFCEGILKALSSLNAASAPVDSKSPVAPHVTLSLRIWIHLCGAALVAAFHAVYFLGRLHPDEVYQTLEPALHRAFQFGIVAWEWQVGLRNWAIPGAIAFVLRAAKGAGIEDPRIWRALIEVPQFGLHLAMLIAVFRLSARRVSENQALFATWLVALYGPVVFFGGRTMGEGISTAFLICGLERLDANTKRVGPAVLAGLLLGCAGVARYGSAAVIFPALVWLVFSRRFKDCILTVVSGGAVALALGYLDLVTWGDWFHSLKAYFNFNVTSGQAVAQFGALPWYYYFQRFFLAPFAGVGFWYWRKRPEVTNWLLVTSAVGYWVTIALTPHKEARFMYPTLVLLTVAAAPAFAQFWTETFSQQTSRRRRAVALVAVLSGSAFYLFNGEFAPQRTAQFQLTAKAGRSATGFALINDGLWGAGGNFYLGTDIPWCTCDFAEQPCFQMAARCSKSAIASGQPCAAVFNRVVTTDTRAETELTQAGFVLLERRGESSLWGRD